MRRALIVAVLLWAATPVRAQILSPGELGKGHAALEGLSNCTRCHVLGKKIDGKLCLVCHEALGGRVQGAQGFHGRGAAAQRPCVDCHQDHRGRAAPLAEWGGPKEKFAHQGTGFALTGAHARAACERCHRAELVKEPELAKRLRQRAEGTHLGLTTRCAACHADPHHDELGSECQRCHDTDRFTPTKGFDHATVFTLQGAHARASCQACHPSAGPAASDGKPMLRYRGVGRACNGCHRDVHGGKFGTRCERCHGQESWGRTRLERTDIAFHERTRFALVGKHRAAACESCHPRKPGGGLVTRNIAFGACRDCHLDAHFGQMTRDDTGHVPCQRCHDERGFFPNRYPLAEHQRGRYPLDGAHRLVACNACHRADPETFRALLPPETRDQPEPLAGNRLLNFTRIRMPDLDLERCESCHSDPHGGQFNRGQATKACSTCHLVSDFRTVTLNHDTETAFPLTGAHRLSTCAACHRPPAESDQPTPWRGAPTACAACHRDPHLGQLGGLTCDGCHETAVFKPSLFSHDDPARKVFRLEGKHRDVPCERCHPSLPGPGELEVVWYRGIPDRCDGCHVNVHASPSTANGDTP